ncbi:MAG TPA: PAS domain S-box protein, partial [bacterium]|nr:PAS domain S-box protein [bacterium]
MCDTDKSMSGILRMFLDNIKDPVSILEEGVFVECNADTLVMLNMKTKEELIGKTPWDISPEYQLDGTLSVVKAKNMIEKSVKEGSNRFEWLHLRPDGSHFYGDIYLINIPDSKKEMVLVLWRDITEVVEKQKVYKETEKAYKTILDNAPTAILIHRDMKWIYANKAVGEIFGVNPRDIMGLDIFKYVAPDQKEEIVKNAQKRSKGEKVPDRYDMHVINEKGEEKYLDAKISPVIFNGEKATLINCVDITERIFSKKLLEQSEEQLRITLNSIGDAVITTNPEGKITMMNPLAQKLTEWDVEDAQGLDLEEVFKIVNAYTRKKVENPVKKVLKFGEVIGLANHTVLCSRNGKEHQISDSGAPILDNKGNIRGVVLVFRDITEQYVLEEQLKQTQKMDAIGQMASGIAHDFNNMLSGLIGNTDLLSDRIKSDAEALEYVESIRTLSMKAVQLTKRLLDFSRKSSDDATDIPIHNLIAETTELVKTGLGQEIKIEKKFCAGVPVVKGNTTQIQNALINLIFNAKDSMPKGGVVSVETSFVEISENTVSPLLLSPGRYLNVSVRDSGTGIA